IISPTEMIALVTLNIKIGEVEGLINICLPYMTLEPVMDNLNTKNWYASLQEKDQQQYSDTIEAVISRAPMPLKAVLGKSTISVNDFLGLQRGDIIRLDTKVDQELNVYVGNIKKFTALPGAAGDNYAIRITSVIREEQ
ncbi:MAG: FliM/FliN family flagellar motor switch protein, partial [Clostridiales bacterium]|nr:FliM/FliN family flagellar motor switch protein [Clostridiales bacterium]